MAALSLGVGARPFLGTRFEVWDDTLIATHAHVIARPLAGAADPEELAIAVPSDQPQREQVRAVKRVGLESERNRAHLRLPGPPLPVLALRDSDSVRDGGHYLVTGFPIGRWISRAVQVPGQGESVSGGSEYQEPVGSIDK